MSATSGSAQSLQFLLHQMLHQPDAWKLHKERWLVKAASRGRLVVIKEMRVRDQLCSLEKKDCQQLRVVNAAVAAGRLPVVDFLLSHPCHHLKNKEEVARKCLPIACAGGHLNVVQSLVTTLVKSVETAVPSPGADNQEPNVDKSVVKHCLNIASQCGNLPIIDFLIQTFPSIWKAVCVSEARLHMPIALAIYEGHMPVVRRLLRDFSPEGRGKGRWLIPDLFRLACREMRKPHALKEMYAFLAQHPTVNDYMRTALMSELCEHGKLDTIKLLIAEPADNTSSWIRCDIMRFLFHASCSGNVELIQCLCRHHNVSPMEIRDFREHRTGYTLLQVYCDGGKATLAGVKFLVEYGQLDQATVLHRTVCGSVFVLGPRGREYSAILRFLVETFRPPASFFFSTTTFDQQRSGTFDFLDLCMDADASDVQFVVTSVGITKEDVDRAMKESDDDRAGSATPWYYQPRDKAVAQYLSETFGQTPLSGKHTWMLQNE